MSAKLELEDELDLIVYDTQVGVKQLYDEMFDIRKLLSQIGVKWSDEDYVRKLLRKLLKGSSHWGNMRTRFDSFTKSNYATADIRTMLAYEEQQLITVMLLPSLDNAEVAVKGSMKTATNAECKGSLQLKVWNGKVSRVITINNVLYVPEFEVNLISPGKLAVEFGCWTQHNKQGAILYTKNDVEVLRAHKVGTLDIIDCEILNPKYTENSGNIICSDSSYAASAEFRSPANLHTWHRRLGHIGKKAILDLAKTVNGMDILPSNSPPRICEACIEGQAHKKPFPVVSHTKSKAINNLLHMDLAGPFEVQSLAHALLPTNLLKKLDARTNRCVMLGYKAGTKAYRVYDMNSKRVVTSRDVTFDESVFPMMKPNHRAYDWSVTTTLSKPRTAHPIIDNDSDDEMPLFYPIFTTTTTPIPSPELIEDDDISTTPTRTQMSPARDATPVTETQQEEDLGNSSQTPTIIATSEYNDGTYPTIHQSRPNPEDSNQASQIIRSGGVTTKDPFESSSPLGFNPSRLPNPLRPYKGYTYEEITDEEPESHSSPPTGRGTSRNKQILSSLNEKDLKNNTRALTAIETVEDKAELSTYSPLYKNPHSFPENRSHRC
ncbi:hypothetical protein BDV3_001903 [Batrachochytrium dendrobatidis]